MSRYAPLLQGVNFIKVPRRHHFFLNHSLLSSTMHRHFFLPQCFRLFFCIRDYASSFNPLFSHTCELIFNGHFLVRGIHLKWFFELHPKKKFLGIRRDTSKELSPNPVKIGLSRVEFDSIQVGFVIRFDFYGV